jgi:1,4-alpha-glucan branching enzyme
VTAASLKRAVAALVRDPKSTRQVWSRQQGYPGDEWYLEFHKIRWPHGLKLWRVTGSDHDLGLKQPYQPDRARQKAHDHAGHFTQVLREIASVERQRDGVIVAPFDTELFGHWWFEGVDFLAGLYQRLHDLEPAASEAPRAPHPSTALRAGRAPRTADRAGTLRPVTGSQHLADHRPKQAVRLASGSWGARGDDSMWLNPDTEWTWRRLWPLEDAFWRVASRALSDDAAHPVLAQAARELLLAQASDWQFIISTGVVRDYGERRFVVHCEAAERLVRALKEDIEGGQRLAEDLARRDNLFPDVLDSVAVSLGRRSRSIR